MKLRLAIFPFAFAAALASAAPAPTGSTAQCRDGTYSTTSDKRGACVSHGGVAHEYARKSEAQDAAAPSASKASGHETPASKRSEAAPSRSESMPDGSAKVWANTATRVYHCEGDHYFGKTKHGDYMTESEAKEKGYHASHGKACA